METMHENIHKNYPILRAVFNIVPEITFVKNTEFVYIAVSEGFARSVGRASASEVIGKDDFEIYEQRLAEKHRLEDRWILGKGEKMENIVEKYFEADGTERYDAVSKYCLFDDEGNPIGIYGTQEDVTKDVHAQQHYEQEIEYLFTLDENAYSTHLIDVNEWKVIHEKRSLMQKAEVVIGEGIDHFIENALECVYIAESEAHSFYKNFQPDNIKTIYRGGKRSMELEYRRIMSNGQVHWVREDIKFIRNPENGHLLVAITISDIEERKQKEQELILRAKTDGLTGLLNRASFIKKVERILKIEGGDTNHALFLMDVDNFKQLNDTKGHQMGDKFLVDMAEAIKSCFRSTDILGRLGGDEFFVLMRHTPSEQITRRNANELINALRQVCSNYESADLSVSIGISIYPYQGESFDAMYKEADAALYRAKRSGKNRFEFASETEEIN